MADDLDDLDGSEGEPQPPQAQIRKTSKTIGVTIKQANAPTATGPAGRGVHLDKRLPASSRYAAWPPRRQEFETASVPMDRIGAGHGRGGRGHLADLWAAVAATA
jgi:hypothetical protein